MVAVTAWLARFSSCGRPILLFGLAVTFRTQRRPRLRLGHWVPCTSGNHDRFLLCLGRASRRLPGPHRRTGRRRGRRSDWGSGRSYRRAGGDRSRYRLALVVHRELRTVPAGAEHLHESVMFCLGDGECPSALDRDPVGGVPASVGPVFRFPIIRSSCAFGAVGAGRDGDQVLRIVQVVCVAFPSVG